MKTYTIFQIAENVILPAYPRYDSMITYNHKIDAEKRAMEICQIASNMGEFLVFVIFDTYSS